MSDFTEAQIARITKIAEARGLNVAGTDKWLLIRDLRGMHLSGLSGPDDSLYHVVAVNDRTGFKYRTTGYPDTLKHVQTIKRKYGKTAKDVRIVIEPAYLWEPGCMRKDKQGECYFRLRADGSIITEDRK